MLELLKEKLKGVTFDVELENFQIGEQFELAEGIGKDHSLYKRLMAKKEEAEKSPWWIERFRANPTKWLDYVAL